MRLSVFVFVFLFILFTVRLHAVLLQIFLSGLQYLWSLNTNSRRFKRPIFSKKGTTKGRKIVFFCSVLLTLVYIVVQKKTFRSPQEALLCCLPYCCSCCAPDSERSFCGGNDREYTPQTALRQGSLAVSESNQRVRPKSTSVNSTVHLSFNTIVEASLCRRTSLSCISLIRHGTDWSVTVLNADMPGLADEKYGPGGENDQRHRCHKYFGNLCLLIFNSRSDMLRIR